MDGGWPIRASVAAVALLTGLATEINAVHAADLGGNCCADLEERIAELEATTARKGNRKVKLEVSGWVNEAVFFWDDGVESNVYVGTNSLEQSRVQFRGEAKISDDWTAGYRLELGVVGAASNTFSQNGTSGNPPTGSTAPSVMVRQSHWYLKSKTYGKVSVGLTGTATYHLLDDTDFTQTRNVSDAEAAAVAIRGFSIRSNGVLLGTTWSNVLAGVNNDTVGQNGRRNIVRYDSPEIGGFTATASWGEDDQAGISLRYAGEFSGFKIAASVGYEKSTDENLSGCYDKASSPGAATQDCEWWGTAATVMHIATGLFVYGGYAELQDNSIDVAVAGADDTSTAWFIQGGIEQKFISLGKTTIFCEYRSDDAGTQSSTVFSSETDFWAAGVVQGIDAAAMQLYAVYRHSDGDFVATAGAPSTTIDDFDMVIAGGRVQF